MIQNSNERKPTRLLQITLSARPVCPTPPPQTISSTRCSGHKTGSIGRSWMWFATGGLIAAEASVPWSALAKPAGRRWPSGFSTSYWTLFVGRNQVAKRCRSSANAMILHRNFKLQDRHNPRPQPRQNSRSLVPALYLEERLAF